MITTKQIERLRPRAFLHRETARGCEVFQPTSLPRLGVKGLTMFALRIDGGLSARIVEGDADWHIAVECPKEKTNGATVRRHRRH